MRNTYWQQRQRLGRSLGLYWLMNCLLWWLLALPFLNQVFPLHLYIASGHGNHLVPLSAFGKGFVTMFLGLTYLSHFALLALIPCVIIPGILLCLRPWRWAISIITISVTCIMSAILIADSIVFYLFHFHLNRTVFHFFNPQQYNQIFEFSTTELHLAIILASLMIIGQTGAWLFAYKLAKRPWPKLKKFILTTIISWLVSMAIIILALSSGMRFLARQTVIFPLYDQMFTALLPGQHRLSQLHHFTSAHSFNPSYYQQPLHYPLHPLTASPHKPLNIIFILIDAWRFDNMTAALTPNIAHFAQHAWQFKQHISGGNGTQAGIFSLFYSLPNNYWTAMLNQKQRPLFLQVLAQRGYQFAIYASGTLEYPDFAHTVFQDMPDLQTQTKGQTPAARDRQITHEFKHFLQRRQTQKPFFAFLFYDAAHGYCEPQDFAQPYQPATKHCDRLQLNNQTDPTPLYNRYKNAVHFVDGQIGQVFTALQQQHLLKSSIIVLTADHGQEFNDNHRNYWEHTSNFTRYQTQVPLLIHWPGKPPHTVNYRTSHYDIVPTLMRYALGINNPFKDYSIGNDLFANTARPFIIASSYFTFAIIETNRITTLANDGDFSVQDPTANPLPNAKPHADRLKQAMLLMRRYFK